MDNSDQRTSEDEPLQLSGADIIARLDEAEADEAASRFVDGPTLVRRLRLKADELEAATKRRSA